MLKYICLFFICASSYTYAFPKKISCFSTDGKFNIRVVNKKSPKEFADLKTPHFVLFKLTYLMDDNQVFKGQFDSFQYLEEDDHSFVGVMTEPTIKGQEKGPEDIELEVISGDLAFGKGSLKMNFDLNKDEVKEEILLDLDCYLTEEP